PQRTGMARPPWIVFITRLGRGDARLPWDCTDGCCLSIPTGLTSNSERASPRPRAVLCVLDSVSGGRRDGARGTGLVLNRRTFRKAPGGPPAAPQGARNPLGHLMGLGGPEAAFRRLSTRVARLNPASSDRALGSSPLPATTGFPPLLPRFLAVFRTP